MRHVALLCGLLLFSLVLPRGAFHCCSHGDAIAADAMDGPAVDQDGSCPICDLMPPPYHGMGPCGIAPRVAELGRVLVATPTVACLGHMDHLPGRGPPRRA